MKRTLFSLAAGAVVLLLPELAHAQASRSRIGKPVPAVKLSDTWGRAIDLSSYKGSTLVLFGATTW